MRFENYLTSAQFYLENIGHCRFSSFYSLQNKDHEALVEMTARAVVGICAALSVYDLVTKSLPFAAKVLVHGALLSIITSLGLSLLLKKILPAAEDKGAEEVLPKEEVIEKEVPAEVDHDLFFKEGEADLIDSPYQRRYSPESPRMSEEGAETVRRNVKRNLTPAFEDCAKELRNDLRDE